MDYEAIIYEVEDNILTITLNRPERLNAFNGQMSSEIHNALDRADADDDVKRSFLLELAEVFARAQTFRVAMKHLTMNQTAAASTLTVEVY